MRFIASIVAAFAVLFSAPTKAADWYKAETDRFTVYSEDSERATREFAVELERLDEVLRILTGVGPDDGSLPESSRLTVFRFGETGDIGTLGGGRGSGIAGFFQGRAIGPVAFAPRRRDIRRERGFERALPDDVRSDPKETLFHEYVHYFMFQHRDAPYPLWYSEGFAELFSNVQFEDDFFIIGDVPTDRSASLAQWSIDLERTFDMPGRIRVNEYVARTYAHGWLIASHLNLNPERRGQMRQYMQAIAEGKEPMEAAKIAFGDLEVLREELEEFRKGRARTLKVPYAVDAEPEVRIRRLTEAEEAQMRTMIVTKRGVDEKKADGVADDARKLADRYPNDPLVIQTAAEAASEARRNDEAEAYARRLQEIDPQSVDATIILADIAMRKAYTDPAQLPVARQLYVDANNLANEHAYPLYGYYLTHLFDESKPVPDDAVAALEASFRYAPFDPAVRQALSHMLIITDRLAGAKIVNSRWVQGNGGFQCLVRKQFDQYADGNEEPLLDMVKPDHPGLYRDEDARKAEQERIEKMVEEYGCTPE